MSLAEGDVMKRETFSAACWLWNTELAGSSAINKRAEVRSLPARTSQRRASSRRNSSGVIQQPPLAHDGRRQRSGHVLGARIEVSRRPANHVRGRPNPPKRAVDAWPVQTLRRIVRKDRAKIQIAVRAIVAAGDGAE